MASVVRKYMNDQVAGVFTKPDDYYDKIEELRIMTRIKTKEFNLHGTIDKFVSLIDKPSGIYKTTIKFAKDFKASQKFKDSIGEKISSALLKINGEMFNDEVCFEILITNNHIVIRTWICNDSRIEKKNDQCGHGYIEIVVTDENDQLLCDCCAEAKHANEEASTN